MGLKFEYLSAGFEQNMFLFSTLGQAKGTYFLDVHQV
jgi:hypothetical protein